jgi:hypothetical protein
MDNEAHSELELHDGSTDESEPGETEYVPHRHLLVGETEGLPGLQALSSPTHSISW